jgi:predicted TIM-barrel fold metal-dependent hydrolase
MPIEGNSTGPQIHNSTGTEPPRLKAPANSADCHIHIFDPRFEPPVPTVANATVADYRRLQQRIGTSRVVIVTPRNYVTDNAVTLDAIRQLGADARGVAVVRPDVTDAELELLDDSGIRGIRFTVFQPKGVVVSIDMIEPLARRIANFGWHVQLHMTGEQVVENAAMLRRLPTTIVFDHLGRLTLPAGLAHPAYKIIRDLVDGGRTWVKLSGPQLNTLSGPPAYSDATAIAQAWVRAAPQRLVWGSDWPHPSEAHQPDYSGLFDLLAEWAPDEATRHRILVTNPEYLYGF